MSHKRLLLGAFAVGLCAGLAAAFLQPTPPAPRDALSNSSRPAPFDGANSPAHFSTTSAVADASAEPPITAANLDARAARAFGHESTRRRDWEIERLFENMTTGEAPAILAKILATSAYHAPSALLGPFFAKWAQLDGASAYAASMQLEGREQKDAEKYLFPAWSKADPHAVWPIVQVAMDEPATRSRGNLSGPYTAAITELGKQDPDFLIRAIASDPRSPFNDHLRTSVIDAAAESGQFPQLLSKISGTASEKDREIWTQQIYQRWTATDSSAPLDEIAKITDPELADSAMKGFLSGWVYTDHVGAINYALDHLEDPVVAQSFGEMLQLFGYKSTREETVALAQRLSHPEAAKQLNASLHSSMTYTNPELIMLLSDQIADPRAKEQIQERAMNSWARKDFEAARTHYNQLTSGETKAKLLPALASQLHQHADGGSALVALLQTAPDPQSRLAVIEKALQTAAQPYSNPSKDYLEGLRLLTEQEPGLSEAAQSHRATLFGKDQ